VRSDTINLINGDPLTGALDRFLAKFGTEGGLLKNFRTRLISTAAEDLSGALGHGAVATFPDQPYLEWAYHYEMPDQAGIDSVERQNANDYMEGASALHEMFRNFAKRREQLADGTGGLDFEAVTAIIRSIVTKGIPRDERIAEWKKAISLGQFSKEGEEIIPDYDHAEWRGQTNLLATLEKPEMASGIPVYHFHHAAAMHRDYVLRELLPQYGIYVI